MVEQKAASTQPKNRMRIFQLPLKASLVIAIAALVGCGSDSYDDYSSSGTSEAKMSPSQLKRQVNIERDLIPRGVHARRYRRYMKPRYITIHSTQNFAYGADARKHSLALKRGKLRAYKRRGGNRIGYLVWHYTIDQSRAVQHLPDNEQGEHADFDGPGNNYSLGLEMCENRGNSRSRTIERTAKLTAYLMHKHKIPLRRVVPHYHWKRRGLSKPHKNCPHFLLDNGRPGRKWRWFLRKVNAYYRMISSSASSPSVYQQPQPTQYPRPYYQPTTPSYPRSPYYTPPRPSYPSYPQYPSRPTYPSYPSYPTYPSYPSRPSYGGYSVP